MGRNPSHNFRLSVEQLKDIALDLKVKAQMGLSQNGMEIKCLPTFIYPFGEKRQGYAYTLDLGGSNLRAALVSLTPDGPTIVQGPVEKSMPWNRDAAFPVDRFLKIQADVLTALEGERCGPLGYCFSFPAASLPDRDARLIRWTKGIVVPETVGRKIGGLLLAYLQSHQPGRFSGISVINDTVASLFAGLTAARTDAHIGLIVGTGTNMAAFFEKARITKIDQPSIRHAMVPVNLESGNFFPAHLTDWDDEVDLESENPGRQRFEKAVSGMYLGRLYKKMVTDGDFREDSGAKGLVAMLNQPQGIDSGLLEAAAALYERSARLIAASIAGVVLLLAEERAIERVRVCAEGSLLWSVVRGENAYLKMVQKTLGNLGKALGIRHISIEFSRIENATLVGSAVAALS